MPNSGRSLEVLLLLRRISERGLGVRSVSGPALFLRPVSSSPVGLLRDGQWHDRSLLGGSAGLETRLPVTPFQGSIGRPSQGFSKISKAPCRPSMIGTICVSSSNYSSSQSSWRYQGGLLSRAFGLFLGVGILRDQLEEEPIRTEASHHRRREL